MNALFLTAITGEICLYINHGIRPSKYNPITLFRQEMAKQGVKVKNTHEDVITQLLWIYHDNGIPRHTMLSKTIIHLAKTKNYVEPTFQPAEPAAGTQPGNPA